MADEGSVTTVSDELRDIKTKYITIGIVSVFALLYTSCYVMYMEKGYQTFCDIDSVVITYITGTASEEPLSSEDYRLLSMVNQLPWPSSFWEATSATVWDPLDYSHPFEGASVKGAKCNGEDDTSTCVKGNSSANGIMTGNCVPLPNDSSTFTCEISGWCPVQENDDPQGESRKVDVTGTADSTVLVLSNVQFRLFGATTDNRPKSNLDGCYYESDSNCPKFHLGTIAEKAGANYSELEEWGGILQVALDWGLCNLDYDVDDCMPEYKFNQLSKSNNKTKYYTTYANYYAVGSRTFVNATGIFFDIEVYGRGGKFNFLTFATIIGGVVGLFNMLNSMLIMLLNAVGYMHVNDLNKQMQNQKKQLEELHNQLQELKKQQQPLESYQLRESET